MVKDNPKQPLFLLLALLLIVLTVVLVNLPSPTGYSIYEDAIHLDSCTSLDEKGYYLLEKDIYVETNCFVINSDDVILDCSGHKVIGSKRGYGIISVNRNNIVIKNCEIVNFLQNIYSENSDIKYINNTIEEVPVVSSENEEAGMFGSAVNFAKTSSGITFLIIALIAGVVIVGLITRAPVPSRDHHELDKFLILAIRKRHKPSEIKQALVDQGWKKPFVDKYFANFVKKLKEKRK